MVRFWTGVVMDEWLKCRPVMRFKGWMKQVFGSRAVMRFRTWVMIEKRFDCRAVMRFRARMKQGLGCWIMMEKGLGCRRAVMRLRDRGQVVQKRVVVKACNSFVNWKRWKGSPRRNDCL